MWPVRCAVHTTRRLQQTAVSCERSIGNKQKILAKSRFWTIFEETAQRVSPFYMLLFTWAQLRTFLLSVMSCTRNRSTATKMCWMKKTTDAISCIASKELVRVCLLQTLWRPTWSTLRWSQNDLSSVRFFQIYWQRSTNSFVSKVLIFRHSIGEIFLRVFCPSGCIPLQFHQCWVAIHEMLSRFGSCRESLQNLSWCISFSIMGNNMFSLFFSLPMTLPWGRPFLMT